MATRRLAVSLRATLIGLLLLLLTLAQAAPTPAAAAATDPIAHDPTIIKQGDYYYSFITGDAGTRTYLPMRRSTDLIHWTTLGVVFGAAPAWIPAELGVTPGDFWAPDINFLNGKYYLYYAASSFGTNNSVIGLATNVTLDPDSPDYKWVDEGLVLRSYSGRDNFNAIDPDVSADADGGLWLAFGSFWDGIKMRRLDAATGKLASTDTTLYSLAARPLALGQNTAIEGASILRYGGYYYLFVSFDFCCRGVNSDYRVVVGRSTAITGPYVDQAGVPMLQGGGTELLRGYNEFRGPGHGDVYVDGATVWYAHHYYDLTDNGAPKLSVRQISWAEGWPTLGDPLSGSREIGHGTAYFAVVNRKNNLALDNAGCGYEGSNIQLWTWLANSCQQWRPEYRADGYSSILNRFSNKVAEAAACGSADGTNVAQWGWLNNNCQMFRFLTTTDGWMRIENRRSGKVMEAAACGTAPGTNVQLWSWLNNVCQEWRIEPVGAVKLVNAGSGLALDAERCGTATGAGVIQLHERDADCQQWTFTHTDSGYYTISNGKRGSRMTIAGCASGKTTAVLGAAAPANACQQFRIEPLNDGTFRLVSRDTGGALAIQGCSGAERAAVGAGAAADSGCQRFRIVLP
jgi:hypothetical protein